MGIDRHSTQAEARGRFAFADVVIDADAHCLLRDGHEIAIEPKAFAVLLEFLAHPGLLLSRDGLLDAVWGHNYVTPGTLNRIVAQLRKALADDSEAPHCIQTVHGLGYRFIAPLENLPAVDAPALRFAPPARARLPQRTEPLIGRGHDLERLAQLQRRTRLVTVVGAGGIGKTRITLELARRLAEEFPDGVWLFDCTAQTDEKGLVRWLADMFDLRTRGGVDESMLHLGELLQRRRALLVFDNGERVAVPLGKIVETLLSASAELCVLVTSQHRLNCAGEALYALSPLELPSSDAWTTAAEVAGLAQVPAVQLLLVRSRAAASAFALTPANAPAVAGICRRLDGLPLALEIAAAHLRLLSPEQLLARMDEQLLNLAEASPSRPARHQTLRALIAWSYALLSEHEQALLRGLSVFVGTCTLGGADAIGAVFGLDGVRILDLLGGLADKSLLVVDTATNPPGYRLLDSVRLFAREKLAESGEEPRMCDAHLEHFVRFSERVYAEIQGERQQLWCDRVRREWANLHAAFDHALARPELGEQALALSANLYWYFRMSSDYFAAVRWLEQALAASSAPTRHRALALVAFGIVLHHAGDRERAAPALREGVALASRLGDGWLAGTGEAVLAYELALCGDFGGAEACVEAALALARARDEPWLHSVALLSRGLTHGLCGRHAEAELCLREAIEWVAGTGCAFFQQAYILINLALQRYYLGDLQAAARDWGHDIDLFIEIQHWRGVAGCVEGAAYLAAACGLAGPSVRYMAAAAGVRRLTAPLFPHWEKGRKLTEHLARDALGTAYEQAWQEGAAARFELVVGEARAMLATIAADQPPRTGASKPAGS
jgi:Predicted ATPase